MIIEEINTLLKEGNYLRHKGGFNYIGYNKDNKFIVFSNGLQSYDYPMRFEINDSFLKVEWIIDNIYKERFDKILNKYEQN